MARRSSPPAHVLYPRGRVIQPNDTREMTEAIVFLSRNKVRFQRTSSTQLKVDCWNYYPRRGTILRDGDTGLLAERGLQAFAQILGLEPPGPAHVSQEAATRPIPAWSRPVVQETPVVPQTI
ncbi:hypothetical protein [Methylobacterium iners]|uniref:Uncharacterized protein n=1 Tax=Methylobacterium iners TaxID=418707 RepID=A0ABQ4S749_9HYPH|nr:hypothetical protein [Methylobacterium iners]GJD97694.1 hypothetical protein OCOJLMKI_4927 [Methylobacterium iners]